MDEVTRSETKLGDYVKKDYKDHDRRYHVNGENLMMKIRSFVRGEIERELRC